MTVPLLVSLPVVMMLFAWPMMGGGRLMLDFWLVGLVLVVGVGYLLYRALSGNDHNPRSKNSGGPTLAANSPTRSTRIAASDWSR